LGFHKASLSGTEEAETSSLRIIPELEAQIYLNGIDVSSAASVNKYRVACKQLYESEGRIVFCNEKSRDLTPLTGVSERIEKLNPEHPEEITPPTAVGGCFKSFL
jgi:hypothetical protein